MLYILIGCLIIIAFLGYKLYQKQKIDKSELDQYLKSLGEAEKDLKEIKEEIKEKWLLYSKYKQDAEYEQYNLEECRKDLSAALDVYNDLTENKLKELDASIEE